MVRVGYQILKQSISEVPVVDAEECGAAWQYVSCEGPFN